MGENKCETCGYEAGNPGGLETHRKSHQERSFECEECGDSFSSPPALGSHMRTHKDTGQYQCDECGDWFKKPSALTAHMKKHSDEKFECEVCGFEGNTKRSLQNHKEIHSEGYECEECGYESRTKAGIELHKSLSHGDGYVNNCGRSEKYEVEGLDEKVQGTWEREIAKKLISEFGKENVKNQVTFNYDVDFLVKGIAIEVKGWYKKSDKEKAKEFMSRYEITYLVIGPPETKEIPSDSHLLWEDRDRLPQLIE